MQTITIMRHQVVAEVELHTSAKGRQAGVILAEKAAAALDHDNPRGDALEWELDGRDYHLILAPRPDQAEAV